MHGRRKRSVTPVYVECDQKATKGKIRSSSISCEINDCFFYPRHHTGVHELIFGKSRGLILMSKAFGARICYLYVSRRTNIICILFASLAGSSSLSFSLHLQSDVASPHLGGLAEAWQRSSIDLRTFRPDRESSPVPFPDLQVTSQESRYRYAKEGFDDPRFKYLFTSASYFSVELAGTPVKRGICGLTSVHKLERLVQNPVSESPPFPIPISSGHLLRTLLHPFGLQGSVGPRKSHLQTTRRPRHLSRCKSFSHPRRPASRPDASQRTKSAASPLSFHL
jgi:hypothetical protein